jgi:hypothetical protein
MLLHIHRKCGHSRNESAATGIKEVGVFGTAAVTAVIAGAHRVHVHLLMQMLVKAGYDPDS